ncbi:MAG TPA: pitrilysin family protein, partial [Candidatus Paceibacterota bacterium]
VAGNVEPKSAFSKIEKSFKGIEEGKIVKKSKFKESQSSPKISIKNKETDQSHLILGFRTFDLHDKRMPVLKVLSTVLGKGMSSRLFQKMREDLGICYYIRSGINDLSDHGNFTVSAGVDKSRLDVAVKGILGELKKIRDEKVGEEELKKAKEYLIGRTYLDLESSDSFAMFYGIQEIMREKIKSPKDIEKEIRAVTANDVLKLAKQIFVNKNLNLAVVGNLKNEKSLAKILSL